jgi:hypothetical protein
MMLNKELAASVLFDAIYTTDEQACQKYGVSVRSLQRWRRLLADGDDPELAGCVATKKAAFDRAWAEQLPVALTKALTTLSECMDAVRADSLLRVNPDMIYSIVGVVKTCAEIELTRKVLNARFGDSDSETRGLFGSDTAESRVSH